MLDEIICSTDIHHFGSHKETFVEKRILLNEGAKPNHFLLGDIADVTGCRNKDVPHAEKFRDELRRLYQERYILGNHECVPIDYRTPFYLHLEEERVVLSHGDYYYWGLEKAQLFRSQSPGKNWINFQASKLFNNAVRARGVGVKDLKPDDLERVANHLKSIGANVLIVGHAHPLETEIRSYDNFTIVTLARGQHKINLQKLRDHGEVAARLH